MGTTTDYFTQIKIPKGTGDQIIVFIAKQSLKKVDTHKNLKMPSMWQRRKLINFIKSQLWVHVFSLFSMTKQEVWKKHFCCIQKQGKYFCNYLNCGLNKPLLHGIDFYLKELLTNKLRSFRFEYLSGIVSKMNDMTLSAQRRGLTELANDKNLALEGKWECWKTCICHHGLHSFPMRWRDDITNVIFWCRSMEYVSI